jgi:PAS domain S-box-containing protein/putative nucleotidyltransferase with HDIG domain
LLIKIIVPEKKKVLVSDMGLKTPADITDKEGLMTSKGESFREDENKYKEEFHDFIEQIFRRDGVEGIANCLPFIDGAFVVTVDGKIVAVNDKFVELLGYERSELYGKEATNVVCSCDKQIVVDRIKENNTNRYPLKLLNKDSEIKHTTVSPRLIEIDNVLYRLAEFVDITAAIDAQKNQIAALKKTANALTVTIEKRDPYTVGHMSRTAAIAVEIAKLLSLDMKSIELISLGARIHDIGKISVPIEILTKPDKLEAHEWEFVKRHPSIGYEILGDIDFDERIKEIVLLHHEHQDGSGYPYGLMGTSISLEVSIVSVADSLEAIAGVRPYREALSFVEAIGIMKQKSNKYHGEALSAACSLVDSGKLVGKEFGVH